MKKRWIIGDGDDVLQSRLSTELNISPLVSRILINRGIRDIASANEFLNVSYKNLIDPFRLNDMEKAVGRLMQVIKRRGRILVSGDYDVDGVTASAIYLEFFRNHGVDAYLNIPDRMKDGYGLNENAVHKAKSLGIDVILTADCGTSSVIPVKAANESGIDVIVTDHHECPPDLPQAFALLNPNRHDSSYPFKGLPGAGVAFKLIQALSTALHGSIDAGLSSYLDLVALAVIADVAPVTGENRYFVKEGLKLLSAEKRPGIAALKEVAGIKGNEVSAGTVSFMLAPRINASGRLSSADDAVKMLTTSDREEARGIALYLDGVNQERQRIEAKIKNEARDKILKEMDAEKANVFVLASREWHQGVVGIVASKIVDEFYRPCVLISLQEDGRGKGSARSIPGFNLYEGLEACKDLLEKFGGHKYAAGLTIKEENVPLLQERLSDIVEERVKKEDFIPRLVMDAEIAPEDISFPLLKEMELLPPYGVSNPEPVIVSRGLRVAETRLVGKDHLKVKLKKGGALWDGIGFSMASAYNNIVQSERKIDVAYTPELNLWKGTYGIQLKLKDIRVSNE
ncbi:MAG: single-stranded-DNA-specific exonuclease RecJ [Nitrospirae bacterium]|nr:single-stranded-DNA-specific exonuclease RecJ [Nitrospirota bacterium]